MIKLITAVSLLCFSSVTLASRFFEIPPLDEIYEYVPLEKPLILDKELDPNKISLLVWNIYKGKNEGLVEHLKHYSHNKDILMLQEWLSTPELIEMQSELPFEFHHGVSFIYKKKRFKTGTTIASRIRVLHGGALRSFDTEPFVKTPKVTTMAKFKIKGQQKKLLLINIHALNLADDEEHYRHIDQAFSEIMMHSGPVIFAGDFNTHKKKRYEYLIRKINFYGLREIGFRNDERMRSFGTKRILDYIFVRGLDVIDSEVLGHLDSSDHKAMVAEFSLSQ